MRLLLAGLSGREIYSFVTNANNKEYSWAITFRQLQNYIHEARELIKDDISKDRQYEISLGISRLNSIYKNAMTAQNYAAALNAQKEINNLLGLAEPARSEVLMTGGPISKVEITLIRDKNDLDFYQDYEAWLSTAEGKTEMKRKELSDSAG